MSSLRLVCVFLALCLLCAYLVLSSAHLEALRTHTDHSLARLALEHVRGLRNHSDYAPGRLAGPPFVLCGELHVPNSESCGTDLPGRDLIDLPLYSIEGASKLVVEGGRMPVIVVVGANNFYWEERSFSRLFASMRGVARESFRMVIVEPVQDFLPGIRERAQRLGIPQGQVSIVQAAIAGHCADPEVSFYRLSSAAVPNFDSSGFGANGLSNHSGMHLAVYKEALMKFGKDPGKADLSQYIVTTTVPCLTPADLLARVGAAASDVAYLKVDAEGQDTPVVSSFLDAGARPAFVMAEAMGSGYDCRPFEEHPLVASLRAAGYLVGAHCDNAALCAVCGVGRSMPQDVLALDTRFILGELSV